MLVNIANNQANAGADVHVITINNLIDRDLVDKFDKRVTVHNLLRARGSYNPLFLFKLNLLLLKLSPDAIHMHASCFIKALWFQRLKRVACCTLHDLPHGLVRRNDLLSRLLPIKDISMDSSVSFIDEVPQIYSISQSVHDALKREYGFESTVVSNGINVSNFAARESVKPHTPLRAVQISRLLHQQKGQDLLIHAVKKLNGRLTVDFIGSGESLEFLKSLSEQLNVTHLVNFLGSKSQTYIARHLCDYDILVQPSVHEGFGLTVAEALAAKVPTLVSSGQGPEEIIEGEKYGWVFNNGDIDNLVYKLEYITDHYDEAIRKSDLAYTHVNEAYNIAVTAKNYLEKYKNQVGGTQN
jgi:glycosyltransferase involved in cell wall biosynthesis